MQDVTRSFPKAKVIDSERVRFELAGNTHRMVASLYFPHELIFIKFIGTHSEYDAIKDITNISIF